MENTKVGVHRDLWYITRPGADLGSMLEHEWRTQVMTMWVRAGFDARERAVTLSSSSSSSSWNSTWSSRATFLRRARQQIIFKESYFELIWISAYIRYLLIFYIFSIFFFTNDICISEILHSWSLSLFAQFYNKFKNLLLAYFYLAHSGLETYYWIRQNINLTT